MDVEIDKLLKNLNEVENFPEVIREINKKINTYEQFLVSESVHDENLEGIISNWRSTLVEAAKKRAGTKPEQRGVFYDGLQSIAMLASKQVQKATKLNDMLKNSTLRLVGLDYTSKDILNEIQKNVKLMKESELEEKKEVFMVLIGFLIFILSCIVILMDKAFNFL